MSHTYTSNAAEVGQHLVDQIRSFGFTTSHEGKALGQLLADDTAAGIQLRSLEQQTDGSGSPWPVNSDNPPGKGYRSKKKRDYDTELTNVRTGQMLSIESLKGRVTVSQHLVEIRYGTGEYSTRGPHGVELNEEGAMHADQRTADTTKAGYAAQQGRGFFELDQDICDTNFKHFQAALAAHIANPGR